MKSLRRRRKLFAWILIWLKVWIFLLQIDTIGDNEDIVDATGSITTYCCSKGWQKQEQVQAYETQRRHGLLDTESTNWRRFPLSVRSHVYPETL